MARRWDPRALIDADGRSLRQVAAALGIDPAVLCRPLTDKQADRYTTRLDLRPERVWGPTWWDEEEKKR